MNWSAALAIATTSRELTFGLKSMGYLSIGLM